MVSPTMLNTLFCSGVIPLKYWWNPPIVLNTLYCIDGIPPQYWTDVLRGDYLSKVMALNYEYFFRGAAVIDWLTSHHTNQNSSYMKTLSLCISCLPTIHLPHHTLHFSSPFICPQCVSLAHKSCFRGLNEQFTASFLKSCVNHKAEVFLNAALCNKYFHLWRKNVPHT